MNDASNEIVPGEVVNEQLDFTDEQLQQFIDGGGSVPKYHTILEVWRETLKPARTEATERVGPGWASKIVAQYSDMTFQDMGYYRDSYFEKIVQLLDILDLEIASDEDCLSYTEPAVDAEENAHHYKNLLLNWQLAIQQWEQEWDHENECAGAEAAAISEAFGVFFGKTGVTQYLDNIGFQFTEDDQSMLAEALQEHRGER